jgi:tRNA threonylcarbamoyladenosine biosynthesis protein TsaB
LNENEDALILGIETATRRGSVCIATGETILATRLGDAASSHSNTLLRDIHELLEESHYSIKDISLIATATGPGSFTGLRIGLASAKALAATLPCACIGVPTLQAVARASGPSPATVALLPAGRGELFAQMLSVSAGGALVELDQPAHLTPDELRNRYRRHPQIRWCGEGAHAWKEEIRKWADSENIRFVESHDDDFHDELGWTLAPPAPILATHVAALAFAEFQQGKAGDPASLRALYVRPSDAELNSHVQHHAGN